MRKLPAAKREQDLQTHHQPDQGRRMDGRCGKYCVENGRAVRREARVAASSPATKE
jgi:hypothetical protein